MVKRAEDDADLLIVQTWLSCRFETPVIIADDTDVAVLAPLNREIFMLKLARGGHESNDLTGTLYSSKSLDQDPFIRDNVLFFLVATGCDTVSWYYKKGKNGRSVRPLMKKAIADSELKKAIEIFKLPNQTSEDIIRAGETCIMAIYKAPNKNKYLNEVRLLLFSGGLTKNKPVNLATWGVEKIL